MTKERIWAIEIRPYAVNSGQIVVADQSSQIFIPETLSGSTGTGEILAKGFGLGEIALTTSPGAWIEWSRSNSYQELSGKMIEIMTLVGSANVRIVEIHNLSMLITPQA